VFAAKGTYVSVHSAAILSVSFIPVLISEAVAGYRGGCRLSVG